MSSVSSEHSENNSSRVKTEAFPRIRQPPSKSLRIRRRDILGFYSMNQDFEFCNDLTQLRYLYMPPEVDFDLKINADKIIRKKCATNDLKLDPIFKWIITHRQECTDNETRYLGDFVTFRGVLSKIMWTPYENHEGWIICASKFQGTIFLCKYDTPEKIKAEESRSKKEKDMGDWGYVFEQYLLSDHPESPPNIHEPNNQNEEFDCVFRANIGPYNVMFSAEMDGIEFRSQKRDLKVIGNDSKRLKKMLEDGDAEFVELKTSFNPRFNPRVERNIKRFKSLKWWVQSYLVGINKLVCGYRDDGGLVRFLKTYAVEELPKLGRGSWEPEICLQYLVDFLKLVEEKVSSGYDEQLWKFTWYPKKDPDAIEVELCDSSSPYLFLYKWATDEMALKKRKSEVISEDSEPSSSKKK